MSFDLDLGVLGGRDVVDPGTIRLDLNVGAFPPALPRHWSVRIEEALRHYGMEDAEGIRNQLAALIGSAHALSIDASNIAVGAGSMALLRYAVEDAIDAKSPVIMSTPGYSGMRRLCGALGAASLNVPRTAAGTIDVAAIVHQARGDAPLVVLNHPVNPTGQAEALDAIDRLMEIPGATVLVDEAYWEYSRCASALDRDLELDRLVVVRTFSKARGMAGVRLGYAVTDPKRVRRWMGRLHPGAISGVTQTLASLALEESPEVFEQRIELTLSERTRLIEGIEAAVGVSPWESRANFVFVPLGDRAGPLHGALAHRGVLVRLVVGEPGLIEGLRVSVGSVPENDAFLRTLELLT